MRSGNLRRGRPVVAGEADGTALVLERPLSLAYGMSLETGRVIDIHAPQHGAMLAGQILVMPVGRGSSTASSVLAEAIRIGLGPAAIVLREVDQILALGAIVARTLYGRVCPILVAEPADFESIRTGDRVTIRIDGTFTIEPAEGVAVSPDPFRDPSMTVIYGVDTCEDTTRARERFGAAGRRFRYVNLDLDPAMRARLHAQGYLATPVVVPPIGEIELEPSDEVLAALIAATA